MPNLTTWGPATVLIVVAALIILAIGGIVVIVHPETLSFADYLDKVWKFALAVAGLGAARGIHLGLSNTGLTDETAADEHPAAIPLPTSDGVDQPDQGDIGSAVVGTKESGNGGA